MIQLSHSWAYIRRKLQLEKIHAPHVHSSTIYNSQDIEANCPWTDEWIKKIWFIYTMDYYSAIKKNEIELFLVRWMDLEAVIQSEVSQKEKIKYCMLTHIYGI